jgi:hypothetical protein
VWGQDWYDEWNYQTGLTGWNNCFSGNVATLLAQTPAQLDALPPEQVISLIGSGGSGLSSGTFLLTFYGDLGEVGGTDPNPQLFRIRHQGGGVLYKNVGTPIINHPDGNAPFSYQMYVTTTTGSIRIVRNCSGATIRGYTIQRIK